MTLYWEHIGANMFTLSENTEWRLYAALDDDECAYIYLEVNGRQYETCWCYDYIQGREKMRLNSYHILEFYSAVVHRVYEMYHTKKIDFLDLDELQNQLLEEYWWNYWKTHGVVLGEHW